MQQYQEGKYYQKIVNDSIHLENEKDIKEFELIINDEVIKNKIDIKAASIQKALKEETNWARVVRNGIEIR